jgi:hypothetical protein
MVCFVARCCLSTDRKPNSTTSLISRYRQYNSYNLVSRAPSMSFILCLLYRIIMLLITRSSRRNLGRADKLPLASPAQSILVSGPNISVFLQDFHMFWNRASYSMSSGLTTTGHSPSTMGDSIGHLLTGPFHHIPHFSLTTYGVLETTQTTEKTPRPTASECNVHGAWKLEQCSHNRRQLLRNGSVNKFPRQRIQIQKVV